MIIDNERPENAGPTDQPHLGPTQDANIADLPDEINIEIADAPQDGDGEAAAEQPARQQQPPKRPRSDPQRRIDQLTGRLRETETNADRLVRENKELLAQLETGGKKTGTETERADRAERAALVHHKESQTLKQQAAQRDLQSAIEAGDSTKQADATTRISSAAAELRDIANWEASHPAPQPKPAVEARQEQREEPRREEQRQQQRAPLAAEAQSFIDENASWFDKSGEDYSPDMADELVNYANRYEQRLKAQGKQAEINSQPYFDKLRSHMRAEFPDYPWEDGDDTTVIPALDAPTTPPSRQQRPNAIQRMPQMTRNNSVLPANGQAAPGARPRNDSVKVAMSDVEKELAVKQWENGVMGKHFKTGKPIANKEQAVEQWAYRKALSAKNGQAA